MDEAGIIVYSEKRFFDNSTVSLVYIITASVAGVLSTSVSSWYHCQNVFREKKSSGVKPLTLYIILCSLLALSIIFSLYYLYPHS